MPFEQEKDLILQPHSWETTVALESQRPLQDLTSTTPPTALHAAARSFIRSTCHHPTTHNTAELSRCLSTYNHRLKQWQARWEELRTDNDDILDELEEQEASLAVQSNVNLAVLAFLQRKINYYTDLLPAAQKSADDTSSLREQIPVNLPVKAQWTSFEKLLHKHGVVYTPPTIVATIRKLITYYRLQHTLYLSVKRGENRSILGYQEAETSFRLTYAPTCPPLPDSPLQENPYDTFMRDFPSKEDVASQLGGISFSKQEIDQLNAWLALQKDSFKAVPLPQPATEPVSQLPAPTQGTTPQATGQPALTSPTKRKLPKMHGVAKLSKVCEFLHGLSQDEAFAVVPSTSQGVKKLMDKLLTPPFTQLYSRLLNSNDSDFLALQYKLATKRLGDYYQKFQETECQAQTKQALSEIAAFGRTVSAFHEDPAKDVREPPQDAVEYN